MQSKTRSAGGQVLWPLVGVLRADTRPSSVRLQALAFVGRCIPRSTWTRTTGSLVRPLRGWTSGQTTLLKRSMGTLTRRTWSLRRRKTLPPRPTWLPRPNGSGKINRMCGVKRREYWLPRTISSSSWPGRWLPIIRKPAARCYSMLKREDGLTKCSIISVFPDHFSPA